MAANRPAFSPRQRTAVNRQTFAASPTSCAANSRRSIRLLILNFSPKTTPHGNRSKTCIFLPHVIASISMVSWVMGVKG
uniref:Uncharacterized protein n=1 Tax=Kalanchoe fedtschenkoi TaxID=63787 RepID=A0A7N1A138_KALFE